jgi:mannosyltransferase OCH1-like enzyme
LGPFNHRLILSSFSVCHNRANKTGCRKAGTHGKGVKMFPKIIHYCWVGGKKNFLGEMCIASWKKYCPGWRLMEWNEENIPIRLFPYLKEAYRHKKFSNVSNFMRLYAIYNHGGIYLDIDVELIKNLDGFLIY